MLVGLTVCRAKPRHQAIGAVLVALVMVFAGCASAEPAIDSSGLASDARLATSISALFQQSLDNNGADYLGPLTEQEQQILERAVAVGSISAADYEAAYGSFIECVRQHGVDPPMQKSANGVYRPVPYDSTKVPFTQDQYTQAVTVCQPIYDAVYQLYAIQQSNPGLYADQDDAAVGCLRYRGIVDATYSVDQFRQDVAGGYQVSTGGYSFPFDVFDPAANACLAAAGYLYYM